MDESGRVCEVLSRESDSRKVKVKFSNDRNMAQIADDIVQKCKYIHPSRAEEVEQLIIKLRKYLQTNPPEATRETDAKRSDAQIQGKASSSTKQRGGPTDTGSSVGRSANAYVEERGTGRDADERRRGEERTRAGASSPGREDDLPPASLDEIDTYLDMMYQVTGKTEKEKEKGLEEQIRGTGMILKLCRDVMNLEQLIQNSTVMGALTRVFQEEYKKSVELTFNLLR